MIKRDPVLHCNHVGDFVQEELNDNDRELIRKSYRYGYTDNYEVTKLAEHAETVEGYNWLNNRAIRLYHMEEASIGEL